ncbi:MAG: S8 family serine peptidase, partial [Acidimicrobiales bacterium]
MRGRSTPARAGLAALFLGAAVVVPPLTAPTPAQAVECRVGHTVYLHRTSRNLESPAFEKAWSLAIGRGVTVAVVDSGVDTGNAHLAGDNVLPGKSLLPGYSDARSDFFGHGTAVAGIIAGQLLAGKSALIGAAPGATILPVRVFYAEPQQGSGPVPYPPDTVRLAEGIRWAAGHGADVINVSLSTPADDPNLGVLKQAVAYAHRKDAVVVASGGDTTGKPTTEPRFPAGFPHVIGVAATNGSGVVDNYSVHGNDIDVSAPGQDVLVAYHANGDCLSNQQPLTSWAAPFVSAEAALLRERFPDESADQIEYRIEASADRPTSSRDDDEGWGEIQPYVALTMTLDPNRPGPTLPGHPPPKPQKSVAHHVHALASTTSPLESVQREGLWWGLGALGLAALALILKPLVEITRRR